MSHPNDAHIAESVRSPQEIEAGLARAREALAAGDLAVAAYLLDESIEDLKRVFGGDSTDGSTDAR